MLTADSNVQPDFFPTAHAEAYNFSRPFNLQDGRNRSLSLVHDLAKTTAFNRLKDIRFLGAIDYRIVPSPNGSPYASRYTRQQHSLGVLKLALRYCKARNISVEDQNVICAAALLHDIGHPPFSHSMEPVFAAKFGIDHHRATEDIIRGRSPLGCDVLFVLRNHNVDIERVVSLIAQRDTSFDRFFSGPITFDTIEGISRSCKYINRRPIPSPQIVMMAAVRRDQRDDADQRMVDNFWRRKGDVYTYINSRTGVLSDFLAQDMLRQNIGRMRPADFYSTEKAMFKKLPGLKQILRDPVDQDVGPVRYLRRTYDINPNGNFYVRQDHTRYLHRKYPCSLDTSATLRRDD